MKKNKKIFYLDFDGVLADSAKECITTSFYAWLKLNENIINDLLDSKESIIKNALKYRYLVTPPEHYFCLIDLLVDIIYFKKEKVIHHDFEKSFKMKINSEDIKTLSKFKKIFFLTRKERFSDKPNSEWLAENPPTEFLKKFKELIRNKDCELIIISRKDTKSISIWLDEIKLEISEIHGNESLIRFNNSKFSLIKSLQLKKNFNEGIFIDDSSDEIIKENWKSIFITPIIAGWGYNHLRDNSKRVLKKIKEDLR